MERKDKAKEKKEIEIDKENSSKKIVIDENYPGPKETDTGNAEKPGIKNQDNSAIKSNKKTE